MGEPVATNQFRWERRKVHVKPNYTGGPGVMEDRWFFQQLWKDGPATQEDVYRALAHHVGEEMFGSEWCDIEGTPEQGFRI